MFLRQAKNKSMCQMYQIFIDTAAICIILAQRILGYYSDLLWAAPEDEVLTEPNIVSAQELSPIHGKCDQGTQRPLLPAVPYKDLAERGQRVLRAEVIDTLKSVALKFVHYVERELKLFISDIINSKKWHSTFGPVASLTTTPEDHLLASLVEEYRNCKDKAESLLTRNRAKEQKGKIVIGDSLKDSRISKQGETTSGGFRNRVEAAASLGRIRSYSDERRRLLSIVVGEYSYAFLHQVFGCSPNTISAAKVHHILFGRGGVPPAHTKFKRQRVSQNVLEKLSDFFSER